MALPANTPPCAAGVIAHDCFLHADPVTGEGPGRTDGRNLIQEAKAAGFVVLRSRGEFEALLEHLKLRPSYAERVRSPLRQHRRVPNDVSDAVRQVPVAGLRQVGADPSLNARRFSPILRVFQSGVLHLFIHVRTRDCIRGTRAGRAATAVGPHSVPGARED